MATAMVRGYGRSLKIAVPDHWGWKITETAERQKQELCQMADRPHMDRALLIGENINLFRTVFLLKKKGHSRC